LDVSVAVVRQFEFVVCWFVIDVVAVVLVEVVDIFVLEFVVVAFVQVGFVLVEVVVVVVASVSLVVFVCLLGGDQLPLSLSVVEVLVVDSGDVFLVAAAEVPVVLVLVELWASMMKMMVVSRCLVH
jgi:hypothetical protein